MNQNTEQQKRLRWACRRGMLELDLKLLPFFEQQFTDLNQTQQQQFIELLTMSDTEIYSWMIGSDEPPAALKSIIDAIRTFRPTGN